MITALIRFSLLQRLMVLLAAGALIAAGIWAFRTLPIDAFPDISPPQVQITVKAPGLAPEEIEARVAFPIETELQGIPRQQILRSTVKYSLANIIVDFEDGTDIYWARTQVAERLNQVRDELPSGAEAVLAPIATPLSDVYMYRVKGDGYSNSELRAIQDWVIRPRLRTAQGVADVNSLGGEVRAYEVVANPARLAAQGLSIEDIERAINANNRNAGGDRINREGKMLLVRTVGQLQDLDDIRRITVVTRGGVPVGVADVAEVRMGSVVRFGGVTADGQGEVVTGLALLRVGANSRTTVEAVKREIARLAPTLPKGVTIEPFYDRADLINAAVRTVETALGEAVLLVIVVLIVLLGNLRAALTVALILPLSVLFTFFLMRLFGVSANLMSLGGLAIAIGILVDAAVVVVENIHTQLGAQTKEINRLSVVFRATSEVATPVISAVLIIVLVFLPLFSLTGLEGRMFAPLAITICFALLGSLVLSLTVIPVLASYLMRNGVHKEERVLALLQRGYAPIVRRALSHRRWAVGGAVVLLLIATVLYPRIGREFLPTMDEGTPVVNLEKASDIALEASLELDTPIQKAILTIPEVTGIVCRTGADELQLDPMGFYQTDCFLGTKPREDWSIDLEGLHEQLRQKLEPFKEDAEAGFSQPIDMRVSEMLTGVRAAVAVKLFGEDLAVLEEKAGEIEEIVKNVNGASDVFRARLSGQGYLKISLRSADLARYGLSREEVNHAVETAIGGKVVTEVIEGSRRTAVLLRYPLPARNSPDAIRNVMLKTPGNALVPLSMVADAQTADGPVQIGREGARRFVVVRTNVEGRDVVGFVDEVRTAINEKVKLPEGYYIVYGGQFENEQRAAKRLAVVVPISVTLIFLMLFTTFGSLRQAGLVLLNVPFALIGGVISLYLSGLYLSVPASVGFITLFGVAVLNGVVMVAYFNQLRETGRSVIESVKEGAARRLRPVLMTALIASLGLVPMLLATGPGSEIQRPLAVVVIGGLITSTLLTLVLLPTLYAWLEAGREYRSKREMETL